MFKLVKILGGRMNVPEIIELEAGSSTQSTETVFKAGKALMHSASTGILTAATGSASAEYICAENKKTVGVEKLKVYKVTPDMLFEVDVSAVPTSAVPGKHYTIDETGEKMTATVVTVATTSSSISNPFGCKLIDKQGASAIGDKVLVTLA